MISIENKDIENYLKKNIMTEDDILPGEDGNYVKAEIEELAEITKKTANDLKERDRKDPTFEELFQETLEATEIGAEAYRPHLESMGLAYELAGLGESNWKNVYNKYYQDIKNNLDIVSRASLGEALKNKQTTPEQEQKIQEETEKAIEQKDFIDILPNTIKTNKYASKVLKVITHYGYTFLIASIINLIAYNFFVELKTIYLHILFSLVNLISYVILIEYTSQFVEYQFEKLFDRLKILNPNCLKHTVKKTEDSNIEEIKKFSTKMTNTITIAFMLTELVSVFYFNETIISKTIGAIFVLFFSIAYGSEYHR